jgi:uncharacterized membrane protein
MRNVMGSWPFVFGFFAVMIIWAVTNTLLLQHVLHHKAFDPYPYILLNLFLSMLAGVQAAALLIAAKRADAVSSEIAIHTEKNTDDLKDLLKENTELTLRVKQNTDLLELIHRQLVALNGAGSGVDGGTGDGVIDVAGNQASDAAGGRPASDDNGAERIDPGPAAERS